jgi:hypothetical protein
MRYDWAWRSLDRHATYIVFTFVAGATDPADPRAVAGIHRLATPAHV